MCCSTKQHKIRKMNVIRSYKHEIYTEEVNKVALNGSDDKRIIMADRIRTMAYGHYQVNQVSENSGTPEVKQ